MTIFISTHFMNEAERCDRISLMHAGRVLASDAPAAITAQRGVATLEAAFIGLLREVTDESAPVFGMRTGAAPAETVGAVGQVDAAGTGNAVGATPAEPVLSSTPVGRGRPTRLLHSLRRIYSYLWREALELQRDPVRSALALGGSVLLMFVMGYGISMDAENLRYAVLDRDRTTLSANYTLNLSGSRYFREQPPIHDYAELDQRMRSGELSLAIEIPSGFARDVRHGRPVQVAAWVDGAMPQRGETVAGFAQGLHQHWISQQLRERGIAQASLIDVETRFRYNPDVKSLPAMVPAVIPLLLLMLPAMLTALAVVREKELGSIINLYVTPTTRTEFLVGKQLPYVALAMLNYGLMCLLAVTVFGVPMTGSFPTLTLAALMYAFSATGMGLLASTLTRSQIAAMFFAMVGTLIPAAQFAGLINPVSSLEGIGRVIGEIHPATYMFLVSRGVFNKALDFADLKHALWPLLLAAPVILGLAVPLLGKQEK